MLDAQYVHQLNKNVWYSGLNISFQDFICRHALTLTFEKDARVFLSGQRFNGMYAVLDGAVRLGYIDIHGKEAIAAIAEPIMWFGEISLVDQLPRSHDAICIKKSTLLHLPAQAIQQLLQQHPEFWFHIAQLTSQKLRYAFMELIALQTQSLSQRLAQRLLFILNGYGNHLEIEQHTIYISQEQLAQLMNCSRQSVNQELQQLEKMQVLRVAFKQIEILDLAQLHQIAHALPVHDV